MKHKGILISKTTQLLRSARQDSTTWAFSNKDFSDITNPRPSDGPTIKNLVDTEDDSGQLKSVVEKSHSINENIGNAIKKGSRGGFNYFHIDRGEDN